MSPLLSAQGSNRYYYMCLSDLLALGGGGNYALCLDEDLLTGTSGACDTFGNECLAHSPEFELKNVECLQLNQNFEIFSTNPFLSNQISIKHLR